VSPTATCQNFPMFLGVSPTATRRDFLFELPRPPSSATSFAAGETPTLPT